MEICSLYLHVKAKSVFHKSTYIAFLAPAYAGNHINEVELSISETDAKDYNVPTFNSRKEALNYAELQFYGAITD